MSYISLKEKLKKIILPKLHQNYFLFRKNTLKVLNYYISYYIVSFLLKILVNTANPMIKNTKQPNKSKAISSYILSGINIKRMIQDELSTDTNFNDLNIIRVNRRPIFKIRQREKQNTSIVSSGLPNKSFKIRSYIKKGKQDIKGEQITSQIFQKIDNFRNFRSNSNRLEVLNISKQGRDEQSSQIQSKIRQILHRQASIKCKVSNQVLVKEVFLKPISRQCVSLQYQKFNTEKYREIGLKINAYFNNGYENKGQKTLVVISMDSFPHPSKKFFRSVMNHDEHFKSQDKFTSSFQDQLDLFKSINELIASTQTSAKIVFKVNNSHELNQMKHLLQMNQIHQYFCIFYPIKKYIQWWNLYQIDCLLQNTQEIIIYESRFKLQNQFPIIKPTIKTIFLTNSNDSLTIFSRTLSSIKDFIIQNSKLGNTNHMQLIQEITQSCQLSQNQKRASTTKVDQSQSCFKLQRQIINISELDARLEFVIKSRELKGNSGKNRNRSSCTQDDKGKRRTLCEKQNLQALSISNKHRNSAINDSACYIEDKWQAQYSKQTSTELIKAKILQILKNQLQNQPTGPMKPSKKIEIVDKNDEVDEITNYLRGNYIKSKTNHQIVSQLIKKNHNICRQIESYLKTLPIPHISHRQSNIFVSMFNQRQDTIQQIQIPQDHTRLQMKIYKIF